MYFPMAQLCSRNSNSPRSPEENPDGSRTEPSGRGYFPGTFNGADVTVKEPKRFASTRGWRFFDFNHFEPKAPTAKVRAELECADCHMAGAKKDQGLDTVLPPAG